MEIWYGGLQSFLYVSCFAGVDVDGQTSKVISSNWEVTDPESGIDFCEWSIGNVSILFIHPPP